VKVILETGELSFSAAIRRASELAILAGADFIKTSTGKISTGATPAAFLVMLDTIREFLKKQAKLSALNLLADQDPGQALLYSGMLLNVLGEQWFHKEYFRIGASSLADEIISTLRTLSIVQKHK